MTRILRGLTSERLACGCMRGVYETYDGRTVAVIDVRGDGCRVPRHERGRREELAPAAVTDRERRATASM